MFAFIIKQQKKHQIKYPWKISRCAVLGINATTKLTLSASVLSVYHIGLDTLQKQKT